MNKVSRFGKRKWRKVYGEADEDNVWLRRGNNGKSGSREQKSAGRIIAKRPRDHQAGKPSAYNDIGATSGPLPHCTL